MDTLRHLAGLLMQSTYKEKGLPVVELEATDVSEKYNLEGDGELSHRVFVLVDSGIGEMNEAISTHPTGLRSTIEKRSQEPLWKDEFGTPFGAHIVKGNVMEGGSHIQVVPSEPNNLRIYGLDYNLRGLPTSIYASKVFRENGLYTEKYKYVKKLEQFLVDGKILDLNGFKQYLTKPSNFSPPGAWDWIHPIINDESFEFYVIGRDVQTGYRLRDLTENKGSPDNIEIEIKNLFEWIDLVHRDEEGYEMFGVSNQKEYGENVMRYFSDWYPRKMGQYLAKMHSLGISHHFAHSQNWQIYPALVDLDSARGEILGSGKIISSDMDGDVSRSFYALSELMDGYLAKYLDHDQFKEMHAKFMFEYLKARGRLSHGTGLKATQDIVGRYRQSSGRQAGIHDENFMNDIAQRVSNLWVAA